MRHADPREELTDLRFAAPPEICGQYIEMPIAFETWLPSEADLAVRIAEIGEPGRERLRAVLRTM